MRRVADGDLPAAALDDVAGVHFPHARRRAPARRRAAARLEDVDAALVLDARADVGAVDAVLAEELLGHARDRRRSVDLEIGNPIRAHVPALEHQPRVVHAVVVVQMAEERVGDVDGAMPALDEPVVGAGAVVHHDKVAADLEEVAGALPRQRRRRRAGAEQRDLHAYRLSPICRRGRHTASVGSTDARQQLQRTERDQFRSAPCRSLGPDDRS